MFCVHISYLDNRETVTLIMQLAKLRRPTSCADCDVTVSKTIAELLLRKNSASKERPKDECLHAMWSLSFKEMDVTRMSLTECPRICTVDQLLG